jgi:hypothetical protein
MHMIFLHIERIYRPGVRFANVTDFLFAKRCNPTCEDTFSIVRTPHKVVCQLVGEVFGLLCIHTCQYNMCSTSCEIPVRAALPLDES